MPEKPELPNGEFDLLNLLGRHRILFDEAAFALTSADSVSETKALLRSLVKKKLINIHSGNTGLAPRVPYYTLTANGASVLGVGRERSTISGNAALSTHLAILWFTAFSEDGIRRRVASTEISDAFGANLHHNCHHVAQKLGEQTIVYRTYCPKASLSTIHKWCVDTLQALPPSYKEAVSTGCYAIAVLCEAEASVEKLRSYLSKPYKKNERLLNRARIIVALAPSTSTFHTEYVRHFGS